MTNANELIYESYYTFGRWSVLTACLVAAGVTGLTSAFGLLAEVIDDSLGYSTSSLALIAAFGNLGSYSGFVAGFAITYFGARFAIQVAAVLTWLGMFLLYLSLRGDIATSVSLLCVYLFIAQIGAATISQATLSSSLRIFPSQSRSQIASLAKSYYGIAGSVLAVVSAAFFPDSGEYFILFCAAFIPAVTLVAGSCVNLLPAEKIPYAYEQSRGRYHLLAPFYYHFLCVLGALICTLVLSLTLDSHFLSMVAGGAMLAVFFSIVFFPLLRYSRSVHDSEDVGVAFLDKQEAGGGRYEPNARDGSIARTFVYTDSMTMRMSVDGEEGFAYRPPLLLDVGSPTSDTYGWGRDSEMSLRDSYYSYTSRTSHGSRGGSEYSRRRRLGSSRSTSTSSRGRRTLSFNKNDRPSFHYQDLPTVEETDMESEDSRGLSKASLDLAAKLSSERSRETSAFYEDQQERNVQDYRHQPEEEESEESEESDGEIDMTLMEVIGTKRCWVVFFVLSVILGSCLVTINLIDSVSTSQRVTTSTPTLVFLITASSALGRVFIGYITSYFEESLTMLQFMGLASLAVGAINLLIGLYIPGELIFLMLVACTGILFGMVKVLQAACAVDMFGVTYVATNSGFMGLSGAVGSYVIAYGVVAATSSPSSSCVGAHCYQSVYFISSVLCLGGFVAAFGLDYALKLRGV